MPLPTGVEKGVFDKPKDHPWQTCTCLGNWHYDRNIYNNGWYKSAASVVGMLVDIISKNGNMVVTLPRGKRPNAISPTLKIELK